jgi:hypothetical protein
MEPSAAKEKEGGDRKHYKRKNGANQELPVPGTIR